MLTTGTYNDPIRLDAKAWSHGVEAQISDRGTVKLTQHAMGRDTTVYLTPAELRALAAMYAPEAVNG